MLENKINNIRKQIAHLEIIKQGKKHATQQKIYEYQLNCKHINTVIEERKQLLTATAAKLKRYKKHVEQFELNRLFQNNQAKVYEQLQGKKNNTNVN